MTAKSEIMITPDLVRRSIELSRLLNAVDCWPNGELLLAGRQCLFLFCHKGQKMHNVAPVH